MGVILGLKGERQSRCGIKVAGAIRVWVVEVGASAWYRKARDRGWFKAGRFISLVRLPGGLCMSS